MRLVTMDFAKTLASSRVMAGSPFTGRSGPTCEDIVGSQCHW